MVCFTVLLVFYVLFNLKANNKTIRQRNRTLYHMWSYKVLSLRFYSFYFFLYQLVILSSYIRRFWYQSESSLPDLQTKAHKQLLRFLLPQALLHPEQYLL